MKKNILFIFLAFLCACTTTMPRISIIGYKSSDGIYGEPKFEPTGTYFDCIEKNQLPNILKKYYFALDTKDFASINEVVDTTAHPYTEKVFLVTKKASAAYLKTNKEIATLLKSLVLDSVTYIYENGTVTTIQDVKRLISLKANDVDTIQYKIENRTLIAIINSRKHK